MEVSLIVDRMTVVRVRETPAMDFNLWLIKSSKARVPWQRTLRT